MGSSSLALCPPPASGRGRPAEEFTFHHENVMGTSLELRVRADSAAGRRAAEARVLARDRPPLGDLQRLRPGQRVPPLAGGTAGAPVAGLARAVRGAPGVRPLAGADRRGLRPAGRGATRLWARAAAARARAADRRGTGRGPGADGRPGLAARPGGAHGRAALGLPAQPRRDRQGVHRRAGLRRGARAGAGVRGLLLNVGGDLRVCGETARTIGDRRPEARLGDVRAARPDRGQGPRGRHQRAARSGGSGSAAGGTRTSSTRGPAGRSSGSAGATVIAERSADADALATTFNVLPPEEGLRLAQSLPGVECLIVDGRRPGRRGATAGAATSGRGPAAGPGRPGGPGRPAKADRREADLGRRISSWSVNFEINQPDGEAGRYRRPVRRGLGRGQGRGSRSGRCRSGSRWGPGPSGGCPT